MCDSDVNVLTNPLGRLISKNEVVVRISKSYNREKLPVPLEESIEGVWQNRLQGNARLFNGTKFRLHAIEKEQQEKVKLNIGVTCYKDFIGTNYSPQAKSFQEQGQEHHKNSQAFLSDAIGVGALLLTSDNQVVMLKRSQYVAEDAGLFDRPGGHAEPNELVGDVLWEQIDVESMSAECVRNELFNSIIREVRDEVNIPEKYLDDPLLIGVYRNPASAGRPGLEFLVRCSLSSREISDLYHQGTQTEADESTDIRFITISDLTKNAEADDMTNSMKTVLKCFHALYIGQCS